MFLCKGDVGRVIASPVNRVLGRREIESSQRMLQTVHRPILKTPRVQRRSWKAENASKVPQRETWQNLDGVCPG